VADDRISLVSLTGGTDTGRRVMAVAAAGPKPVLLELGGKSANIVFDDADLGKAVAGTLAGVFADAGQRCFSGTRILVQDSVADAFIEQLGSATSRLSIGDPLVATVDVGPVIGPATVERAASASADAAQRGAAVIEHPAALPIAGSYVSPTLIVRPSTEAVAWREELFAPVAVIETFGDDEEAITLANDSEFGLAGGCWTTSIGRALDVARDVTTGYFWVNAYSALTFEAPFGGARRSGVGSEFGRRGVEAYSREKTVSIDLTGGDAARVFDVD
jgi:acyl-CoA reductase-like NAD-dependent aldehyde dehydrogenase